MRFLEHLPHITALMSERPDGPMGSSKNDGERGELGENRRRFLESYGIDPCYAVMAGLVNGTAVRTILDPPPDRRVENADGLVVRGPSRISLALASQDCFPLFFAPIDPSDGQEFIGIAHAGWEGILGGIVFAMMSRIEGMGIDRRKDLAIAIGPGIRSCCFLVRDDERGLRQYLDRGLEAFVGQAQADKEGEARYPVDLRGIILSQLHVGLGIPPEHVTADTACTMCDGERFFSWRRDHAKGNNMLSAIRFNRPKQFEELKL